MLNVAGGIGVFVAVAVGKGFVAVGGTGLFVTVAVGGGEFVG
jgi:hypothetical protein